MKRCKQCSQRPGTKYYAIAHRADLPITSYALCDKCHSTYTPSEEALGLKRRDWGSILFTSKTDALIHQVTEGLV